MKKSIKDGLTKVHRFKTEHVVLIQWRDKTIERRGPKPRIGSQNQGYSAEMIAKICETYKALNNTMGTARLLKLDRNAVDRVLYKAGLK